MTRAIPFLIVLMLCLSLPGRSAIADDDTVELTLRFTEGQQLTLTTTAEQTTTRTWNDQDRESEETSSMTTGLKVLSLNDDGTATIEVTIEAVVLKADMGRWSYEYDSNNPPDEVPRAAAPFAAVVGETFTMKLTPGGDVAGFEGVDALRKTAQDAIPDEGRGRRRRRGRGRVERHISEDAFTLTMEAAFGFLPDEPVAVDDSWTRTINVDRGIPVQCEETYTLTELKDGTAAITLEAKLGPQEEDEAEDGPRVAYDITGTQKGTLTVDEATGCLFKIVITQQLDGDMIMSGFRGDDTERTMPLESDATITIECTEPPPEEEPEDAPKAE